MLRQDAIESIPNETVRVAQAAFPNGHRYLKLADEIGALFNDASSAGLYSERGQPALPPWRLALVTMLQFAEGLSDRQAAAAVSSRIDWKYVLRLELTDPGFDASVLSEFRTRLVVGNAECQLFDRLLTWCRERDFVAPSGRQRSDSTHILAVVRALNRIEIVGETVRYVLNRLAVVAPEWLAPLCPDEWVKRYARRAEDDRLPTKQTAREALAHTIGQDGLHLLTAIYNTAAPEWLRTLPAVAILRQVWLQNYTWNEEQLVWRDSESIPPVRQYISSPYDAEAHYAQKQSTQWVGYKIHVTESCDDERPHLITHVTTTPGPVADGDVTPLIHAALKQRDLLPSTHIVDTGFLDAELMVTSYEDYGIDLFGPPRHDRHWQAQENKGFAAHNFEIDWNKGQATCPAGVTSKNWTRVLDNRNTQVIKIKFPAKECGRCVHLQSCVRSKKRYPRRTLTLRTHEHYIALQAARQRETTESFQEQYNRRAGIEGTLSRGTRTTRLRRTRYLGLARVRLGHILTGLGLNALRLGKWFLAAEQSKTRITPFFRLMTPTLFRNCSRFRQQYRS